MDLKLAVFTLVILSGALGSKVLETEDYISAYMNHRVTLPCTYYNGNDWVFIRWKKVNDSSSDSTILAHLVRTEGTPSWQASAPNNFRDHVELQASIQGDKVSFSMVIDGFGCDDVGTYECEVTSLSMDSPPRSRTTLDIEAHPGTPSIDHDTIQAVENSTFTVECSANVGKPASELKWSYKLVGHNTFQLVTDGLVEQSNRPAEDCTFIGKSVITLTMTEALDGARFMCYNHGELGEKGEPLNHDDVVLQLHGKTTTTEKPPSTIAVTQANDDDINSASSSFMSVHVMSGCLATLHVLRVLTTR